jgi:hypothetical protein
VRLSPFICLTLYNVTRFIFNVVPSFSPLFSNLKLIFHQQQQKCNKATIKCYCTRNMYWWLFFFGIWLDVQIAGFFVCVKYEVLWTYFIRVFKYCAITLLCTFICMYIRYICFLVWSIFMWKCGDFKRAHGKESVRDGRWINIQSIISQNFSILKNLLFVTVFACVLTQKQHNASNSTLSSCMLLFRALTSYHMCHLPSHMKWSG